MRGPKDSRKRSATRATRSDAIRHRPAGHRSRLGHPIALERLPTSRPFALIAVGRSAGGVAICLSKARGLVNAFVNTTPPHCALQDPTRLHDGSASVLGNLP
jgi:hypothetical protein